jgi:hypothetical protein
MPSKIQPISESQWMARLQSVVAESHLSEALGFYAWACPAYRQLVELEIPLTTPLSSQTVEWLAEKLCTWGPKWLAAMPFSPVLREPTESAIQGVWARFRSTVLARAGLGRVQMV